MNFSAVSKNQLAVLAFLYACPDYKYEHETYASLEKIIRNINCTVEDVYALFDMYYVKEVPIPFGESEYYEITAEGTDVINELSLDEIKELVQITKTKKAYNMLTWLHNLLWEFQSEQLSVSKY